MHILMYQSPLKQVQQTVKMPEPCSEVVIPGSPGGTDIKIVAASRPLTSDYNLQGLEMLHLPHALAVLALFITICTGIPLSRNEGTENRISYVHRSARQINTNKLWRDRTVPYKIKYDQPLAWVHDGDHVLKRSLQYLEDRTCLKFPHWTPTLQQELNLSHNNFIHFMSNNRSGRTNCYANLGMLNKPGVGQYVSIGKSCNSMGTILHETVHSLGFNHERSRYDRDAFVLIEDIEGNELSPLNTKVTLYAPYDLQSRMSALKHASPLYDEDYLPSAPKTLLSYYDQMGISLAYSCDQGPDCPSSCQNGGFAGVFYGVCRCKCPLGLGGDSCEHEYRQPAAPTVWPAGGFGLIKSQDGCPQDDMETGERYETTDQKNPKNKWSDGHHFAGELHKKRLHLEFCMAANGGNNGTGSWPKGSYCIFQQNQACPEGFESGWIQMDDENLDSKNENYVTGSVPYGIYDNDTRYYFCCRNDDLQESFVVLPNKRPFYLLMNQDRKGYCQNVAGMYHRVEFITWDDQDTDASIVDKALPHPWTSGSSNYKISFCYYRPLTYCGGLIDLSVDGSAQIQSPSYPDTYPADHECNWLVKSPEGTQITLEITDLDIEEGLTDCVDYVEVKWHEMGHPGRKTCGTVLPKIERSIHNVMIVTFHSEESGSNKGFQATLQAIEVNPCTEPPQPPNTETLVHTSTPGTFMAYRCMQGYVKTSGDLARQCQTDGTWSGIPLVCEEEELAK